MNQEKDKRPLVFIHPSSFILHPSEVTLSSSVSADALHDFSGLFLAFFGVDFRAAQGGVTEDDLGGLGVVLLPDHGGLSMSKLVGVPERERWLPPARLGNGLAVALDQPVFARAAAIFFRISDFGFRISSAAILARE